MSFPELFLIALALSMDAFSASVCRGLALFHVTVKQEAKVGLYFGLAQALMPLIGWLLAGTVVTKIAVYAPYIAFGILLLIGAHTILEACRAEEEKADASLSFGTLFPLAIATSIDALTVGFSFALLEVKILPAAGLIGLTTFVLSAVGVKLGHVIGKAFRKAAAFVGGIVLILIGVKILLSSVL